MIRINSEGSNLPQMTVYLVPSAGTRERLGNVPVDQVRDFELRDARLVGTYRILVRPEGRGEIYSPEFNLARGDVVEWNLRLNRVYFRGTQGG